MNTPACGKTGVAPRLDYRGRSVRCAVCLNIVVHENGDTAKPYVHWTDLAPTGLPWHMYTTRRGHAFGRLHVPRDWRKQPVGLGWGEDNAA